MSSVLRGAALKVLVLSCALHVYTLAPTNFILLQVGSSRAHPACQYLPWTPQATHRAHTGQLHKLNWAVLLMRGSPPLTHALGTVPCHHQTPISCSTQQNISCRLQQTTQLRYIACDGSPASGGVSGATRVGAHATRNVLGAPDAAPWPHAPRNTKPRWADPAAQSTWL